jgi:hypothetical protein
MIGNNMFFLSFLPARRRNRGTDIGTFFCGAIKLVQRS